MDEQGVANLKRCFLRCGACLIVICLFAVNASAEALRWKGVAKDFRGNRLYEEIHNSELDNSKIKSSSTEYFFQGNDREPDARMTSTYGELPQHSSYTLDEIVYGYRDGVRLESNRFIAFEKEKDEEEKTESFPLTPRQVMGQGFHYFVQQELDRILEGEIFEIDLVLPGRLETFDFRLKRNSYDETSGEIDVSLEVNSWILRLFISRVSLIYDVNSKRLLRYEGISNLRKFKGEKVYVTYEYGDSVELSSPI